MNQLDGKVAWITGAGRGQGRSHALALAERGATILATDVGPSGAGPSTPYELATEEDLAETARLVEAAGGRCLTKVVDVRSSASVNDLTEWSADHGGIDVLVANAGIISYGKINELSDDQWDEVIATNLTGVFRCIRTVVPHMVEQGWGRIVATSSMAGRIGLPNMAHYVSSKWGVIGLVKATALEVSRKGVTVNAVCPGTVDTPMMHHQASYELFCPDIESPTFEDALPRMAVGSRMKEPLLESEQISSAVVYLVCEASGTTGSVMPVCLGASALNS